MQSARKHIVRLQMRREFDVKHRCKTSLRSIIAYDNLFEVFRRRVHNGFQKRIANVQPCLCISSFVLRHRSRIRSNVRQKSSVDFQFQSDASSMVDL